MYAAACAVGWQPAPRARRFDDERRSSPNAHFHLILTRNKKRKLLFWFVHCQMNRGAVACAAGPEPQEELPLETLTAGSGDYWPRSTGLPNGLAILLMSVLLTGALAHAA